MRFWLYECFINISMKRLTSHLNAAFRVLDFHLFLYFSNQTSVCTVRWHVLNVIPFTMWCLYIISLIAYIICANETSSYRIVIVLYCCIWMLRPNGTRVDCYYLCSNFLWDLNSGVSIANVISPILSNFRYLFITYDICNLEILPFCVSSVTDSTSVQCDRPSVCRLL